MSKLMRYLRRPLSGTAMTEEEYEDGRPGDAYYEDRLLERPLPPHAEGDAEQQRELELLRQTLPESQVQVRVLR